MKKCIVLLIEPEKRLYWVAIYVLTYVLSFLLTMINLWWIGNDEIRVVMLKLETKDIGFNFGFFIKQFNTFQYRCSFRIHHIWTWLITFALFRFKGNIFCLSWTSPSNYLILLCLSELTLLKESQMQVLPVFRTLRYSNNKINILPTWKIKKHKNKKIT